MIRIHLLGYYPSIRNKPEIIEGYTTQRIRVSRVEVTSSCKKCDEVFLTLYTFLNDYIGQILLEPSYGTAPESQENLQLMESTFHKLQYLIMDAMKRLPEKRKKTSEEKEGEKVLDYIIKKWRGKVTPTYPTFIIENPETGRRIFLLVEREAHLTPFHIMQAVKKASEKLLRPIPQKTDRIKIIPRESPCLTTYKLRKFTMKP